MLVLESVAANKTNNGRDYQEYRTTGVRPRSICHLANLLGNVRLHEL